MTLKKLLDAAAEKEIQEKLSKIMNLRHQERSKNFRLCALCHKRGILEHGHIIPCFVINYLKILSAKPGWIQSTTFDVKYVSNSATNGHKAYLFCDVCEKRMGKIEQYVAENLFKPYHDGEIGSLSYDYRLQQFCALQTFRVMTEGAEECLQKMHTHLHIYFFEAMSALREFVLFGDKSNAKQYTHTIQLLAAPTNSNFTYSAHSVDCNIGNLGEDVILVYTKLCRIWLVTYIYPPKLPESGMGTPFIFKCGMLKYSTRRDKELKASKHFQNMATKFQQISTKTSVY